MSSALLLGGGAPTLTLQSGALAALDEKGVEFAAVSTAGAGMVIGLLYAAPKGMTRQEALRNTVNMGSPTRSTTRFR
jgi:NTE family protein